jgi:hypothetical protein
VEKLAASPKAVNLTATRDFSAASGEFAARRVLLELRPAN